MCSTPAGASFADLSLRNTAQSGHVCCWNDHRYAPHHDHWCDHWWCRAQVKEAWAKGISGSIEKDFGRVSDHRQAAVFPVLLCY